MINFRGTKIPAQQLESLRGKQLLPVCQTQKQRDPAALLKLAQAGQEIPANAEDTGVGGSPVLCQLLPADAEEDVEQGALYHGQRELSGFQSEGKLLRCGIFRQQPVYPVLQLGGDVREIGQPRPGKQRIVQECGKIVQRGRTVAVYGRKKEGTGGPWNGAGDHAAAFFCRRQQAADCCGRRKDLSWSRTVVACVTPQDGGRTHGGAQPEQSLQILDAQYGVGRREKLAGNGKIVREKSQQRLLTGLRKGEPLL